MAWRRDRGPSSRRCSDFTARVDTDPSRCPCWSQRPAAPTRQKGRGGVNQIRACLDLQKSARNRGVFGKWTDCWPLRVETVAHGCVGAGQLPRCARLPGKPCITNTQPTPRGGFTQCPASETAPMLCRRTGPCTPLSCCWGDRRHAPPAATLMRLSVHVEVQSGEGFADGGAWFPGAHGRAGFKNPAADDIPSTGRRSGATKNEGAGAGDRTSRGEACRRCRVRHDCHS